MANVNNSHAPAGATYLTPWSFGYAIANKEPDSNLLMVLPVEHFPAVDGEVNSTMETLEVSGTDSDGKAYSTKAIGGSGLPCEWLPFGSNRQTAPDVRRKERVLIYRWADQDKYFWVSLGLDEHLRRLERVLWVFNANPNVEGTDTIDFKSSYYFEVSTRDRLVTFATSKANDEPFAYTIQLNTAEGHLIVGDDDDNFVELDSRNTEIRAHNKFGTMIELAKKFFNAFAPDSINMTAAKNIVLKATQILLQANHVAIKAPQTDVSGNLTVGGAVKAASVSSSGSMTAASVSATTIKADQYQNLPPR